jgi:hypothetical protein
VGAFTQLIEKLDAHYAAEPDSRLLPIAGILTDALSQDSIIDICKDAVENWQPDLAGSSSGSAEFTKISLYKSPEFGYNLRIHIFGPHLKDEIIHSHKWDLSSVLVSGELVFTNYRVMYANEDEFDDLYYCLNYTDDPNSGYAWGHGGEARLLRTSEYVLTAGSEHTIQYEEPHLAVNPSPHSAITFLVLSPARREGAAIFTAEDQIPEEDRSVDWPVPTDQFVPLVEAAFNDRGPMIR